MRERETKISEAAIVLERAERLATSDPAAALPEVQEALRASRRAGVQCLETRAFATLGAILALLGRLDQSEAAHGVAYRSACPCCRPVVDRLSAFLLNKQGRKPEALARATRAVETAREPERGRALVTLGTVRFYAGDVSGAVQDVSTALRAAKDAADVVFSTERKAQLGEALGALRAATVEAGAPPPIMSYAAA